MINFDDICKWLKKNGFRMVSLNGPSKKTFINKDYTITIIVDEHKEEMTAKDEEIIKKRLVELGYL